MLHADRSRVEFERERSGLDRKRGVLDGERGDHDEGSDRRDPEVPCGIPGLGLNRMRTAAVRGDLAVVRSDGEGWHNSPGTESSSISTVVTPTLSDASASIHSGSPAIAVQSLPGRISEIAGGVLSRALNPTAWEPPSGDLPGWGAEAAHGPVSAITAYSESAPSGSGFASSVVASAPAP